MAARDEVVVRLRTQGRKETVRDVHAVADEVEQAGHAAETAGRRARSGARGFTSFADRKITAGVTGLTRGLGTLARTSGSVLVKGTKAGAVALGGLAVAAGLLGMSSLHLASDAGETASKFSTVLGPAAAATDKTLQGMTARFGLSGTMLQDATAGFAVLGQQVGLNGKALSRFGTDLTQAGLDLGSFYNAAPEEAFAALQSGLTGEAEPLKRFNIFMSDAALNAFAAAKGIGKTTQKMSEQEKIALRQSFILANLGKANGDLARTSDSLANSTRANAGRWETLRTRLGTALVPAAKSASNVLGKVLTGALSRLDVMLPRLTARSEAFGKGLERTADRVGKQLPNLLGTVKDRDSYGFAEVLDNMLGNTGTKIDPIVSSIDRVTGAVDRARPVLSDLGTVFVTAGSASPALLTPLGALRIALGFAADHTTALKRALMVILPVWGAYRIAVVAANVVSTVAGALALARVGTTALLTGAVVTNTGAELTRNQALVAGVAIQLRMAGAMMANTARTVASTVATRAAAGAARVFAAGQWLVNAALTANPIGLVVVAIGLLVAAFVVAWKHSETFRKVVISGFAAMGKAVLTWVDGYLWGFQKVLEGASHLPDWLGGGVATDAVSKIKGIRTQIQGMKDDLDALTKPRTVQVSTAFTGTAGQAAVNAKRDRLDARAAGGPVRAFRPYVVGERGPELMVPRQDGQVMTARETTALMRTRALPERDQPALKPMVERREYKFTIVEAGDPHKTLAMVKQALQDAEADA